MSVERREGSAPSTTGFIWPRGVVGGKSSDHPSHVSWAQWHFSLEPGELGCADLAKHEIRVVDDEPFKEWFQRIPPPMVNGVHTHVKEMLEVGAIYPRQIPLYNAVMLVCKEDGGLYFCIEFWKLNARTKIDSYLLPQIQEAIESLVGVAYFSCLDLKADFWQ